MDFPPPAASNRAKAAPWRLDLLYVALMSSYRVAIELDEGLAARLKAAAAKEQTTAEAFAADAVARAVADVETWAEDQAAYAEYERTGEALPLAAVEAWVTSWGTKNELPSPEPCKSSSETCPRGPGPAQEISGIT
jgi:predicted transcriptional regulator